MAVLSTDPSGAARVLAATGLSALRTDGDEVTAALGGVEPEAVVAALVRGGVPVRGFRVLTADLEEMFVELTGQGFDVSG